MAAEPHIVIAGAGALGCFLGGTWARLGLPVSLLMRPRISAELRAHGLSLTDHHGLASQVPQEAFQLSHAPQILAQADVIVVTCKATQIAPLAEDIQRHAAAHAVILVLTTGPQATATLRAALPGRDVRAGLATFGVQALGQGCFHRTAPGVVAMQDGAWRYDSYLTGPELPVLRSAEIEGLQWGGWLIRLNDALNALSGLPLPEQMRDRGWRRVLADQWAEGLAVALKSGAMPQVHSGGRAARMPLKLRLPDALYSDRTGVFAHADPTARSPMAFDLIQRRTTEIDALQGEVIRLGAAHNLPTPLSATVQDLIKLAEVAREGLPDLPLAAIEAERKAARLESKKARA